MSYIFITFGKFITTYMRMRSFGSYHNIPVYGYIIIINVSTMSMYDDRQPIPVVIMYSFQVVLIQ